MSLTSIAFAAVLAAVPTAKDKSEARALKNAAFQKIAEGSFEEGVVLLRQAHEIVPHPGFLFNIAVVYDQWPGHCAESLAAFDEFFGACADCKARATAEARVERVKERCLARLNITSDPVGAEVTLDGKLRGAAPLDVRLAPGTHRLQLDADGFEPAMRVFELEAGASKELAFALRPVAPSPAPRKSPPTLDPITASPDFHRPGAGLRRAGWIALATGVVGTGVGVAYWVLRDEALAEEERLTALDGVDAELVRDARSLAQERDTLAWVGFGVGAAGVASGVILHILAGQKARKANLALGSDGRRLLLSGRF